MSEAFDLCPEHYCWYENTGVSLTPGPLKNFASPITLEISDAQRSQVDYLLHSMTPTDSLNSNVTSHCPAIYPEQNENSATTSSEKLYGFMGTALKVMTGISTDSSFSPAIASNSPSMTIAIIAFTAMTGIKYFYHHEKDEQCIGSLNPIEHHIPQTTLNISELDISIPIEQLDFNDTDTQYVVIDDTAPITDNAKAQEKQSGILESINWYKLAKYTATISALGASAYLLPTLPVVSPILCLLLKSTSMSALGDFLGYLCPELGEITNTVNTKYFSYSVGGMIVSPFIFSEQESLLGKLLFAVSARTIGGVVSNLYFSDTDEALLNPYQAVKDICKSTIRTVLSEVVLAPVSQLGSLFKYSTKFLSSAFTNTILDTGKAAFNGTINTEKTQSTIQHRSIIAAAKVVTNALTTSLGIKGGDSDKLIEYAAKTSASWSFHHFSTQQ